MTAHARIGIRKGQLKIDSRVARYYTTAKIHVGHTNHLIGLLSFVLS